ncbi:MAG: hypothetical protein NWE96_04545 [Candidatus Bathyarchaeota archaeon]|nr:hypothetical protein [Candidatus Bathyarchaeota archaeon]
MTIILANYRLSIENHDEKSGRVVLKVEPVFRRFGEKDVEGIKILIAENLGKWESLVKSSFQLFYEIGIIDGSKALAQIYNQPSGIELYEEVSAEGDPWGDCIWVSIALTQEEYLKRKASKITPSIAASEIESQLNNIPKWIDAKRALEGIKVILKS